jgi:hypothetical protein
MWGVESFAAPRSAMCRFSCAGLPAVRIDPRDDSGTGLFVWLLRSGAPHELVVAAHGFAAAEQPTANAIALSVCDAR